MLMKRWTNKKFGRMKIVRMKMIRYLIFEDSDALLTWLLIFLLRSQAKHSIPDAAIKNFSMHFISFSVNRVSSSSK